MFWVLKYLIKKTFIIVLFACVNITLADTDETVKFLSIQKQFSETKDTDYLFKELNSIIDATLDERLKIQAEYEIYKYCIAKNDPRKCYDYVFNCVKSYRGDKQNFNYLLFLLEKSRLGLLLNFCDKPDGVEEVLSIIIDGVQAPPSYKEVTNQKLYILKKFIIASALLQELEFIEKHSKADNSLEKIVQNMKNKYSGHQDKKIIFQILDRGLSVKSKTVPVKKSMPKEQGNNDEEMTGLVSGTVKTPDVIKKPEWTRVDLQIRNVNDKSIVVSQSDAAGTVRYTKKFNYTIVVFFVGLLLGVSLIVIGYKL